VCVFEHASGKQIELCSPMHVGLLPLNRSEQASSMDIQYKFVATYTAVAHIQLYDGWYERRILEGAQIFDRGLSLPLSPLKHPWHRFPGQTLPGKVLSDHPLGPLGLLGKGKRQSQHAIIARIAIVRASNQCPHTHTSDARPLARQATTPANSANTRSQPYLPPDCTGGCTTSKP
jgi:hypothetical protein